MMWEAEKSQLSVQEGLCWSKMLTDLRYLFIRMKWW